MSNLVERYIHQVGRYVPGRERAEIEAELRSQIQDQLDDRYKGAPTDAEIAAVLKELGDPRRMAASYGGEQYLIGPNLYPVMMMVLRRGWVLVPPIAAVVHVLAALFGNETGNLIGLLLETIFGALQATVIFTAIVVLIFAILQHSGEDLAEITGSETEFDPLGLPEVDDPGDIDRGEAVFGIAFGAFAVLVLLYFLRVGGLTLRFNLSDPGDVIPVPVAWLIALILIIIAEVVLQLLALLRGRWTVPTWLANILLEAGSAVALYFVVWQPLLGRALATVPELTRVPLIQRGPEIILVASVVLSLFSGISKLVKMLIHRDGSPKSYNVKASG